MHQSSQQNTLGVDFGTSNSAAGILVNGRPHLIEIEPGLTTIPTAVFFDFARKRTLFGNAANAALLEGRDGRYMRSLKSVLGTSLMHEKRLMMGENLTFIDIIGRFLKEIKSKAEASCGQGFDYALSGRPVHFHSSDEAKDNQALVDLKECYLRAGFRDVKFLFEPEAAAVANGALARKGTIGLIVDIGGGTSDFSLFKSADRKVETAHDIKIIASHGVRVGGTNFDKCISVDHVMPLFGKGTEIRKELGPGTHTAPNAIFQELATWEKIPFLYSRATRRDVALLHRLAQDRHLFSRLATALELELGHDIAFAVERGKIEANKADRNGSKIDLRAVEPQLSVAVSKEDLTQSLDHLGLKIQNCAMETLVMANCPAPLVDKVIFVGGSSLMSVVGCAISEILPNAEIAYSDAFTAIVDGLAIAASRPFADLPA